MIRFNLTGSWSSAKRWFVNGGTGATVAALLRLREPLARSDEGQRAAEFGGEECARTRGVDEALAQLAERSRCEFINTGLVANVAGGAGHPGNMEWRTREDHTLKTKFDTMQCQLKRTAAKQ